MKSAVTVEAVVFHDVWPGIHPRLPDRSTLGGGDLAPDHEPTLGSPRFPGPPAWTSGYRLAEGASLLIHDAQYTSDEYARPIGWGHRSFDRALALAELSWVEALVTFHHDPWHGDQMLDEVAATIGSRPLGFDVIPDGLARSWTSMRPAVRCPWLPDSLISTSE